jgi:hypothetical protein
MYQEHCGTSVILILTQPAQNQSFIIKIGDHIQSKRVLTYTEDTYLDNP